MQTSDQGVDLLTQREGRRNDVYLDTEGIPTVGVGFVGPDVIMGEIWTNERINERMRTLLDKFEAAINSTITVPLEHHQFDSLLSFGWNVGIEGEEHSTMVAEINAGFPAEQVAAQFDRWHIPAEITARRNGEKFQFLGTTFSARCDNAGNPVA